jgi:hypothetical protein
MVELNFSFYARPGAEQLARMADRAGERMLFSLKAHQSLTHERPEDPGPEAAALRAAVAPLAERSRLGAVLLQFPFSFHYEPAARRYLDRLCRSLEGLPAAVEFRNREWQRESVLRALAERNVAFVNVDQPEAARGERRRDLRPRLPAIPRAQPDELVDGRQRNALRLPLFGRGARGVGRPGAGDPEAGEDGADRLQQSLPRSGRAERADDEGAAGAQRPRAGRVKPSCRSGFGEPVCRVLIPGGDVIIFRSAHMLLSGSPGFSTSFSPGTNLDRGGPPGFRPPFPWGLFYAMRPPGFRPPFPRRPSF